MANHSSASVREQTPHVNNSTNHISDALKRRAQSLIKDRSIDAESRAFIRYGLEVNDPWLAELVRRADAGETIIDNMYVPQTRAADSSEEKMEALAALICRAGDEPETKSVALLVLMATLENSTHSKALANKVKHLAFTRCGELNVYGMVDAQIAVLESELSAGNLLA